MRLYQQLKNIYHWLQAQMWRALYRWPDRHLTLYGVTGTNGKTTTALVLGSILRAAHGREKIGLISTEVFWFGPNERSNETHMTSVDAAKVFRYLREMVNGGVTHVVLEMTSHALDQHRLAGLRLTGAIILNIAHEHLDYHQTMAEYARAKGRIIDHLKDGASLVVKKDNEWIEKILKWRGLSISTSPLPLSSPEERVDRRNGPGEVVVIGFTSEVAKSVTTPLPGDFNKENVLAASLLAEALGVSSEHVAQGVAAVTQVPGRVEWITLPNGARAVVDFALTPYSYEQLFKYLRAETTGSLVAVFGAAGRRDTEKRPLITKIVAEYADEIVLTQDEPYDDPEEEIYRDLERGLDPACKESPASAKATAGTQHSNSTAHCKVVWRRIPDRREALKYALQKSTSGDVIAVTGMGNYNVRVVGDKKISWNDKKVILELSKELE